MTENVMDVSKRVWTSIRSIVVILVLMQSMMLFFLPAVIQKIDLITILFGFLSFITILLMLANKKWPENNIISVSITLFFGMILVSTANVFWGNVLLAEFIRGLIPFMWLSFYFVYLVYFSNNELRANFTILYMVGNLCSVMIIVNYFLYCLSNPYARVTFYYLNSTLPFPMFSILVALYCILDERRAWHYALLILNLFAVMVTETKSMVICTIVGVICMLVFSRMRDVRKKRMAIIKIVAVMAVVVYASFSLLSIGDRWDFIAITLPSNSEQPAISPGGSNPAQNTDSAQIRIEDNDKGSLGVRIIEMNIAWREFKNNIIIGNGLGYKYNAEDVGYGSPKVAYMHNIIAYVLMDFGLVGICILVCLLVGIIYTSMDNYRKLSSSYKANNLFNINILVSSMIIMFISYCMFFAMFRNIQSVYAFAFFLAMLSIIKRELRKTSVEISEGKNV